MSVLFQQAADSYYTFTSCQLSTFHAQRTGGAQGILLYSSSKS